MLIQPSAEKRFLPLLHSRGSEGRALIPKRLPSRARASGNESPFFGTLPKYLLATGRNLL